MLQVDAYNCVAIGPVSYCHVGGLIYFMCEF